MASAQPVVVYPPGGDGGRRVRVEGQFVGMAYGLLDIVEFLRPAGLENVDDDRGGRSPMIQWRDGGPDSWEES